MENARTQTAQREISFNPLIADVESETALQRLDALLALNGKSTLDEKLSRAETARLNVFSAANRLTDAQVFSYFGLMLGVFPPAAIFTKLFVSGGNFSGDDFWFIGVLAIVNLISAIVGYFSGRVVGTSVTELEKLSWTKMLLSLPFVGILWGLLAGGAGGIIVFVVGAFVGAIFGAAVGAVALPLFAIFHRWLKKDEMMERGQFLPIAFGITMAICAMILGW